MEKYDDPNDPRDSADIAGLLSGLAADPTADLTSEQVTALFAVALDGAPPSTVTAESVLREVRAAEAVRRPRLLSAEWFAEHASAWKWGGGLVAAAAVVGAVVVSVPGAGGSSDASGSMYSASAESQADTAGDAIEQPSSAADDSDRLGAPDMAMAAPGDGDAAGEMSLESASEPAAAAGSSGSEAVVRPPLTDAEWAAAVGALPAGVTGTREDQVLREKGASVVGADVRADRIGLGSPESFVEVVVGPDTGPDTGPGTDYPGPADDEDTVGNVAERLRHSGYVTVQVADGTTRVAVAAPEGVLNIVTEPDLHAIAEAVLAAAR